MDEVQGMDRGRFHYTGGQLQFYRGMVAEGEGGDPIKKNFDTIVILLHWRIWKERNARILDNVASSADRVRDLVLQDIGTWRAAGCIADLDT